MATVNRIVYCVPTRAWVGICQWTVLVAANKRSLCVTPVLGISLAPLVQLRIWSCWSSTTKPGILLPWASITVDIIPMYSPPFFPDTVAVTRSPGIALVDVRTMSKGKVSGAYVCSVPGWTGLMVPQTKFGAPELNPSAIQAASSTSSRVRQL